MNQKLQPYKYSKLLSFPKTEESDNETDFVKQELKGAISQDGSFVWTTKGSYLEVFNTSTTEKCGSWKFGAHLSKQTTILLVHEIVHSTYPSHSSLIVVTQTYDSCSVICVFDLKTYRVIKAIEVEHKVCSIIPLKSLIQENFHSALKLMNTPTCLGTNRGVLLILDLQLTFTTEDSNEIYPQQSIGLTIQSNGYSIKRKGVDFHNQPFHLLLNEDDLKNENLLFEDYEASREYSHSSNQIAVVALSHIPNINMLLVGFDFGGFQMWDLFSLAKVYSRMVDNDILSSILTFSFQEPENDPCNLSYLWVLHEQSSINSDSKHLCASMFALTFINKSNTSDFTYPYRLFQGCQKRLDYWLGPNPYNSLKHTSFKSTSNLVTCSNLLKGDLSLCLFAWEIYELANEMPKQHLILFDINQWYKAQMPFSFSSEFFSPNPFLSVYSLEEISNQLESTKLLDIHVDTRRLARFTFHTNMEEFFYPSSLAFRILCFCDSGIIQASFLGIQRQILSEINRDGPLCLLEPKELYQLCVLSGLVTCHLENSMTSNQEFQQREALLNLCLEHCSTSFLLACAHQWPSGEHSGCSLQFLFSWTWKKVNFIKNTIDKMATPFFNCFTLELDVNTVRIFHNFLRQLEIIQQLFGVLGSINPTTDQDDEFLSSYITGL